MEKTFARAIELEDARLEGETERMLADPAYQSFNHRHHAYRRRGEYAHLSRRSSTGSAATGSC
ncbi:MAG: hypothetical protein R2734_14550 [Nocardioides sp.]